MVAAASEKYLEISRRITARIGEELHDEAMGDVRTLIRSADADSLAAAAHCLMWNAVKLGRSIDPNDVVDAMKDTLSGLQALAPSADVKLSQQRLVSGFALLAHALHGQAKFRPVQMDCINMVLQHADPQSPDRSYAAFHKAWVEQRGGAPMPRPRFSPRGVCLSSPGGAAAGSS
jgi:hypothetical protein